MHPKLPPAEYTWETIRSKEFLSTARKIITASVPVGMNIVSVQHVRSSHYAAYRVSTEDGSWLVRIGLIAPEDSAAVDNSGFLGTSTTIPSGQKREKIVAEGYREFGGQVVAPSHYIDVDGLDILWIPLIKDNGIDIDAEGWAQALNSLTYFIPEESEAAVFTNRTKSMNRLERLPKEMALTLKREYDEKLSRFFDVSTRWSLVHGDAHALNAMNTGDGVILFDFDTVCWAPSVWDATHLINRAGKEKHASYSVDTLTTLLEVTPREVSAALELRRVAARISVEYSARGTQHPFVS